jgi:hypothetical protein
MPFPSLPQYAVLVGGKVIRFQNDTLIAEGETVLPVIADPDPPLAADEELSGPDFEILSDRVRAYGRVVKTALAEIDMQGTLTRALATALFEVVNEVRVLKGQGTITAAQFKTYLKTKMS